MGRKIVILSRLAGPRENRRSIIILSPYHSFHQYISKHLKKEVDLKEKEINSNCKQPIAEAPAGRLTFMIVSSDCGSAG